MTRKQACSECFAYSKSSHFVVLPLYKFYYYLKTDLLQFAVFNISLYIIETVITLARVGGGYST